MRVAEGAEKELRLPEEEGGQLEADEANKRAGFETSEVWIPADMGFACKGRRVDKREEGVPFVAGVKAGSAKASAAKTESKTFYRDNAGCDPGESDMDVRLCV